MHNLSVSRIVRWCRASRGSVLLIIIAVSLPFSMYVALFPGHLDGAIYLYIGEMWAHGTIPYLQLFDNKPPGIFATIAIAAHTYRTLYTLSLIEFLFVLMSVWTVRRILQRCAAPQGAVFFGTIATALIINLGAFGPGNNPETDMLWPMTASMLAFLNAFESRKIRFFVLAGALSGLACMFKPFGLSALFAQIAFTLVQGRKLGKRGIVISIAANLAGAIIAWIPALAYFSLHGALHELLDASFFYNVHYGVASQKSVLDNTGLLAERLLPVSTIVACLAVGLIKSRSDDPGRSARGNSLWTLTALWFGAGVVLVLAAGRGYGHYFMSLAPTLGVAAGLFFWWVEEQESMGRLRVTVGILVLAPVCAAYIEGLTKVAKDLETVVMRRREVLPVDTVAWELRQIAPRSSTLIVWGFEPSLFYSTHLRNAIRYPTTQYIYDSPRSYADVGATVINGMRSTPPDFVVITPWNFSMNWPHESDPVHDEFMAIVQQSYVQVWEGYSYFIYRRR